jgi:hypothetical protein
MIHRDKGELLRINYTGNKWHVFAVLDSGEYVSTMNSSYSPLPLNKFGPKLQRLIGRYGPTEPDCDIPKQLLNLDIMVEHYNGNIVYAELYGPERKYLKYVGK